MGIVPGVSTDSPRGVQARAVAVAVLVGIAGLVAGSALVVVAGLTLTGLGVDLGIAEVLVVAAVLSQIGFAATGVGFVVLTGRGIDYLRARVPTGRDLLWIGGGYLLALAGAMTGAILATITSAPTATNQVAEFGIERPETLLLLIPISFLFIGPGEEILFRGTVQARLRETFGPLVAVVAASALFAGLHVVALTGSFQGQLVSVGLLFVPSLVLGAAYERTRNLVVTALVHGAYDATLFGLLYVAIQYAPGP